MTRPDVDAAVAKMTTKMGGKREIKKLPEHLAEGERVSHIALGHYSGGQGILVLTDRRVFFLKDGVMKQSSEDFPLSAITSIQWNAGMMMGKVQVVVGGAKSEIENVAKPDGKAIVDAARAKISNSGAPAASSMFSMAEPVATPVVAPVASAPSPLEQLKQLGELHQAGILTDEEFAAKKTSLLEQI